MTEDCPTCAGPRIADDPDHLAAYVHTERCALARAERETWDEDRARFRRYGTPLRRRPASPAERTLLRASGVRVPEGECFTTVQWHDGTRTRTWRRQPVVSVTASATCLGDATASSTNGAARLGDCTPLGGTPRADPTARTDREAAPTSVHLDHFALHPPTPRRSTP